MPSGLITQNPAMVIGQLNAVNDIAPGQSVLNALGGSYYGGLLGVRVALGPDEVRYKSSVGTLYGGVYQYVKVSATHTASPAVGTLAYWLPVSSTVLEDQYTVSADAQPATTAPTLVAGVFLNAITPGNYGWIQIAGRATVLYDSSITDNTVGDLVTAKVSATVASTADAIVSTTTGLMVAGALGIAEVQPVASALKTILMFPRFIRI